MSEVNALSPKPADRLQRALVALDGLSVGDAFGQQFFIPGMRESCLIGRRLPPPRWLYTDDTVMALAIVETLKLHGTIDQDALVVRFAERYSQEPNRGYGSGAQRLLREIGNGGDWRTQSRALFSGSGSWGNGGAMRVAPLGAYFADNLELVVRQAALSAEVTHAHPEGVAGAIAVAIAAAWCCRNAGAANPNTRAMLQAVLEHTPASATRLGIEQARDIPLDEWEYTAANLLGNGEKLTAADTVPFCLWCAAAHLDSFTAALWAAMHVEGDIDTNCAIIGGIVASATGRAGIPAEWLRSREGLA